MFKLIINKINISSPSTDYIILSIYKLIIGIIFIYAIYIRFMFPLVPFTGPDSIGYLGVAFNFLNTGIFSGIAERAYPYPGFLTLLISTSKDPSVVTLFQHLLGILGGVLFLKIMDLVKQTFLTLNRKELFIYKIITLIGLFLLLISPWEITIEHWTSPEALTLPLIMFYFFSALKLYTTRQHQQSTLKNLQWSIIFFICNYLIFIFQPRFGIAFLIGGLSFYFYHMSGSKRPLHKLVLMAIPTLAVSLLINIPQIKHYSYKEAVDCNRAASFFYYNLNTIAPLLQSDIDNPNFKDFDKAILKQILTDFTLAKAPENRNFSSGYFKTVGYNSDFLGRTYYFVLSKSNNSFAEATKLYQYYLSRALFSNPFGLMSKIFTEMKSFYSESTIFQVTPGFNFNAYWENSYNTVSTWKGIFTKDSQVYDFYIKSLDSTKDININYRLPTTYAVENILGFLNKVYTILCIIFLMILFISYILKSRYLKFGILIFSVMIFGICVNLTISIGATTLVQRYIYDQHSWNLLFIIFSFFFIFLVLKNDLAFKTIKILFTPKPHGKR